MPGGLERPLKNACASDKGLPSVAICRQPTVRNAGCRQQRRVSAKTAPAKHGMCFGVQSIQVQRTRARARSHPSQARQCPRGPANRWAFGFGSLSQPISSAAEPASPRRCKRRTCPFWRDPTCADVPARESKSPTRRPTVTLERREAAPLASDPGLALAPRSPTRGPYPGPGSSYLPIGRLPAICTHTGAVRLARSQKSGN
jgi:hypothetical protein